ncbi:hypothetical protein G6F32_015623 [Rhizopus arrhizus]|nr:hypothetical protein G6F32_015623 [Rhizopus arrhizus]
MRQTHQFQHFFNAARAIRARQLAQAERHIQGHSQMWEQGVVLEHHANVAAVRGHMGHVVLVEQQTSASGCVKARNAAQQGGLTAAAGPQQRVERAVGNVQRQIAQHLLPAESLDDAVYRDRCHFWVPAWVPAS